MKQPVMLTVNGAVHEGEAEPRELLVHYLRRAVGLTGTHVGCDTSQCGACTVLLDDEAVKSCTVLAVQASAHQVTTIEGLASGDELDPVQQAFIAEHGLQCGYCTPGFVLAARHLLDRNPDPSEAEIRRGLEGNVCRCTGYVNIVRAVQAAAAADKPAAGRPAAREPGMIPAAFDYYRPQSIADAVGLLAELGDEAKVLAGGHSLLPLMRLRFAAPAALVDIQDLRDLRFVTRDGDRVRVGALTRHRDLEADPVIRESVPLLSAVAGEIGDVQIRNRGTIGGSVAHADPAGEYPTVCLMLDAEIVTSRRRIAAAEFFLGRFTTPLADDELITELVFPVTEGRPAYTKFCHRLFDWALVGAAAQRTRHGWRVGLVNVSDTPVRVRGVEQALDAGAGHAEAARLASEGLAPTPALRASAEYKLHLTRVLTRRVIETAAGA